MPISLFALGTRNPQYTTVFMHTISFISSKCTWSPTNSNDICVKLTIPTLNLSTGQQLTVAGLKNLTQLTPAQISQLQLFKQQALRQQQMQQQQQHSSQLKQVRICEKVKMFLVKRDRVGYSKLQVCKRKINSAMTFCFPKT